MGIGMPLSTANGDGVAAITTVYQEIRFRSRLEATWAAFFDLVGWHWTYEPFDLDGYIPDFTLNFAKPLLVEVKPFAPGKEDLWDVVAERISKVWDKEILLLGYDVWKGEYDEPVIGYLIANEWIDNDHEVYCDESRIIHCLRCGKDSLNATYGWWACRRCLQYSYDSDVDGFDGDLRSLFAKAKNVVQWNK
jgi:hypothetical protein